MINFVRKAEKIQKNGRRAEISTSCGDGEKAFFSSETGENLRYWPESGEKIQGGDGRTSFQI